MTLDTDKKREVIDKYKTSEMDTKQSPMSKSHFDSKN
jgi:hypothetical protein